MSPEEAAADWIVGKIFGPGERPATILEILGPPESVRLARDLWVEDTIRRADTVSLLKVEEVRTLRAAVEAGVFDGAIAEELAAAVSETLP